MRGWETGGSSRWNEIYSVRSECVGCLSDFDGIVVLQFFSRESNSAGLINNVPVSPISLCNSCFQLRPSSDARYTPKTYKGYPSIPLPEPFYRPRMKDSSTSMIVVKTRF